MLTFLVAAPSFAATIDWTDWNAFNSGSATGTMDSGAISVNFSGNLETSRTQTGTGTNYWTEGDPAPYTGNSVVDNAPTAAEMVTLNRAGQATITFSEALLNPVMAIVSQGRTGLPVTYDFDQSFTVLSEGRGYWGDGWYNHDTSNDLLEGFELHAVIQFTGLISEINMSYNPSEFWHGITFGNVGSAAVPEPATVMLFGLGLLGLAGVSRKK